MSSARLIANRMLDEIPDEMLKEVIVYISFIKNLSSSKLFNDLEEASLSSTDFWDNEIDDEVWNNV